MGTRFGTMKETGGASTSSTPQACSRRFLRKKQHHPTPQAWRRGLSKSVTLPAFWRRCQTGNKLRETEAKVVKVTLAYLGREHFLDHRDKVSQGANRAQGRSL